MNFLGLPCKCGLGRRIQRQTKTPQTRLQKEWFEITNTDGIIVILNPDSRCYLYIIYQVCIIYYYNCIRVYYDIKKILLYAISLYSTIPITNTAMGRWHGDDPTSRRRPLLARFFNCFSSFRDFESFFYFSEVILHENGKISI